MTKYCRCSRAVTTQLQPRQVTEHTCLGGSTVTQLWSSRKIKSGRFPRQALLSLVFPLLLPFFSTPCFISCSCC